MNILKDRTSRKSTAFSRYEEHLPPVRAREYIVRCLLAAAACFICTFGRMVGFPSYMNVAVCAVCESFSPAALLGAAVCCAIRGTLAGQAVQLGSMLAITALNVFFPNYSKDGDPIRLSLSTAAVTLLLSCIVSAADMTSFNVSMRMISSLLCACVVYAAAFIADQLRTGAAVKVRGLNAVYLSMIYIVSVATLCSVSIGPFNPGRVLACAAIPAAAKKRRAAGGAVMGALSSVAVMMCSSALAGNTMLLAAAGLICSAFCDLGRVVPAIAFMLSAAAALATSGLNSDTFNMLADIIAGAAIFTAIPYNLFSKLMSKFLFLGSAADNAGQTASSRLTFAAMTITDIRKRLALISDTVEARAEDPDLADRVMPELCGDCRLYDECRKNGCAKNLTRQIRDGIETPVAVGCIRAAELPQLISLCRERQLADRAEAVRLKELRLLLREQLGTMSDLLNDLSFRLSRRREIDVKLSAAAKAYFERLDFNGVRACVYTDESLGRHVEVYLSGSFEQQALSVTAGLCRALELDLELPGVTAAGSITKLEFDETAPLPHSSAVTLRRGHRYAPATRWRHSAARREKNTCSSPTAWAAANALSWTLRYRSSWLADCCAPGYPCQRLSGSSIRCWESRTGRRASLPWICCGWIFLPAGLSSCAPAPRPPILSATAVL